MRGVSGRNGVLARAEARLAERRIVTRGEQVEDGVARIKPTTPGLRSSSSSLSAFPTDSDLSFLSNLNATRLVAEEEETVSAAESTSLAQPRSRFLKQKQNVAMDIKQAGLNPVPRGPTKGRPGAILRKLAQIEGKIQNRKPRQGTSLTSALDDELSLPESSSDSEFRTRDLRYLKKTARLKENVKTQLKNMTLTDKAGSDNEDGGNGFRQRVTKKSKNQGDSVRFIFSGKASPEKSSDLRFLSEEESVERAPHHSPSTPNRNISRANSRTSFSSPISVKGSPTDTKSHEMSSTCHSQRSLFQGSIIRSLDELFSDVSETYKDTFSNSDFRVNILSLDDLEPCTVSRKAELKEEAVGKSTEKSGAALFPPDTQRPFKTSAVPLEEGENLEETEISEQLNSKSSECIPCKEESPSNTEYSEDFEPSLFSVTSKKTGEEFSSEKSCDHSDASVHSLQPDLSSLHCPSMATECTKAINKIKVKEAAVQTGYPSVAYHWLQSDVPVAIGQTIEQSSVETLLIGHHKLNMEVLEALTMYRPSVLALNNMLKQNLLLIQQSVEINRRLHDSFVASLEEEEFHYHTLEEAKMYIEQHKSPPLTMEQALREMKDQEQMTF